MLELRWGYCARMFIEAVRTEGLGDSTYVVVHDGVAVIIDPQRDFDRFLDVVLRHGADLRFILETHLHNDYVSGGLAMAGVTGAELVMPAGAAPAFRHTPAFHGEDLDAGPFRLRPVHTPGHTPEHVSYVAVLDDSDHAVFSGGSLLVRSAGRTDLLGGERAESLARLQHGSVHRLAALDDDVLLMPTHGEGSFCASTGGAGRTTSTIGRERDDNPVLRLPDQQAFVDDQLAGLGPYPSYYAAMGPRNLAGPPPMTPPPPRLLSVDQIPDTSTVIDVRPPETFAAGHLPGALGITYSDEVGVWTGWLTPTDTPITIVATPDQDVDDVVLQMGRIGFDDICGVVTDLTPAAGRLLSYPTSSVDEFVSAWHRGDIGTVVDVRGPDEVAAGTLGGATTVHAPDLIADPTRIGDPQDVWVLCASGFRATITAGPLESAGHRPHVVTGGGVPDVRTRLDTSPVDTSPVSGSSRHEA